MTDPVCYVTSDLHLGGGVGDTLEDFHQDDAFAAWVGGLDAASTLVLNGDIIDFAQIEPLTVPPRPSNLLWDEATSLEKLTSAMNGHPQFFDALAAFIERGGHLAMVIGNHDLDMIWPGVQARVRHRVGNPPEDRLIFEVTGLDYHGVHIEHGHHFTPENCPRNPREFVHRHNDGSGERLYLERVWGTDFVISFLNHLEAEFPFADKAKPALRVLATGIHQRWIKPRHFLALLAFLKRRKLPPKWWDAVLADDPDLEQLRRQVTLAHVAGSFNEPEWQRFVVDIIADPELRRDTETALAALDIEDLAAINEPIKVDLKENPFRSDQPEPNVLRAFHDSREVQAARGRAEHGSRHVVCGHTHAVIDGYNLNDRGARLFNPGTWIPRLHLEDPLALLGPETLDVVTSFKRRSRGGRW
jgi:UDP-2,3-diacylglucosamine pyrophosphatase LpxH